MFAKLRIIVPALAMPLFMGAIFAELNAIIEFIEAEKTK